MEALRQYRAFKPPPDDSVAQEKARGEITYVSFEPSDPANPQNWSPAYKVAVVSQLAFLTLSLTYASSASSSARDGMMREFACNTVVGQASTGLFLIGAGIGAMPFAPLSERKYAECAEWTPVLIAVYGRLPVYLGTIFLATIFEIGCALAPNAPALLVLRFLAGLVSSAPLSNAGGTLNDIGTGVSRTLMFGFFATCGFVGPVLAPLIGGYIVENDKFGWRWCYWVVAIWHALAVTLTAGLMPETLAPALLKLKAQRLRRTTGTAGWRARVEDESLKEATVRALKRPFKMLAVEPVVQFFVVYLTSEYRAA